MAHKVKATEYFVSFHAHGRAGSSIGGYIYSRLQSHKYVAIINMQIHPQKKINMQIYSYDSFFNIIRMTLLIAE